MSPEELSTIIDQIYSAALNPNEWRDVALAIQSVIGAHTVNFAIEDTKNKKYRFLFTNGATLDQIEHYSTNVMDHDELTASFDTKPTGIAFLTQEEWSVPQLNNFQAYQEFYKEIGSTYFIGGEFYRSKNSRAYVSVARSHLDPLFTKENQSVLQLLLPHLNRALCIGMHFIEKESQINSLKGDLNHLKAAIILLSENGNLTHANAQAESYILNNFTNKGNCSVQLPDSRANRKLQESIRRILNSSEICEPIYTNFKHIGGQHTAICTPWYNEFNTHHWTGDTAKCLIIIIPASPEHIVTNNVKMMYDLSNAEARIFKEYLDGKNARDVAQSLFVSESTVRFHVRNILLKTHSNSMLEATVKTLKMLSLPII